MEVDSNFAPPRNRLSAKCSVSFSSLFVAMVYGRGCGSCFVLRLVPSSHRLAIHCSYSRSCFVRCGGGRGLC
ncbi:hypothetical protein VNO80_19205 [Phaseolus coccineus]|uniref:Uncharacterized protein n=1 Tax=Phaseolus coccineus TaxID=3886 RepID=A0AAN9MLS8_PHACN